MLVTIETSAKSQMHFPNIREGEQTFNSLGTFVAIFMTSGFAIFDLRNVKSIDGPISSNSMRGNFCPDLLSEMVYTLKYTFPGLPSASSGPAVTEIMYSRPTRLI